MQYPLHPFAVKHLSPNHFSVLKKALPILITRLATTRNSAFHMPEQDTKESAVLFLGRTNQVFSSDTDWTISSESYTTTNPTTLTNITEVLLRHLMWLTQDSHILFPTLTSSHCCSFKFFLPSPNPPQGTLPSTCEASTLSSGRRLNLVGLDRLLQG